jgi:mannose/fructose/N-acetylgalactosamine-specific phosphotransferase system component IIB
MPVVLARVDDRLIHGQVVEGWLRVIQAGRIVVASDEAAADALQQGLMRLAVPPDVEVTVLAVDAAAEKLVAGEWASDRVMLLVPGIREARRLVDAGVPLSSLNLGGIHDGPGRTFLTPFLALNEEDLNHIRDVRGILDRRTGSDGGKK